jgi:hypothetical protein
MKTYKKIAEDDFKGAKRDVGFRPERAARFSAGQRPAYGMRMNQSPERAAPNGGSHDAGHPYRAKHDGESLRGALPLAKAGCPFRAETLPNIVNVIF